MKNTEPKTVSIRLRLVEDIDCYLWEFHRGHHHSEIHEEAWRFLIGNLPLAKGWELPAIVIKNFSSEQIIERLLKVAKRKGFRVEKLCGQQYRLTKTLPFIPPQPEKAAVDLKWSLWSKDESTWEERQPGLLARMEAAFNGTGPKLEITTAPRKEIRYGSVTISKRQAVGTFACEWDDAESLADTLGTTADEAFIECLPGSVFLGAIGVEHTFDIKSRSLAGLLAAVDKEEDEMIKENDKIWKELESLYNPKNREVAK